MPHFHETNSGRRFFESQFPTLVKQLNVIADELKKSNELNEGFIREANMDLETLAKVIRETDAYFLIEKIAEYDHTSAQVLDVLVMNCKE